MDKHNTTAPPGKPAAEAPARRKRRAPKPVTAEWVVRLGYQGWGIALIGRGEEMTPYRVEEVVGAVEGGDTMEVVGYAVRKLDGDTHNIDCTGLEPTCTCPGFIRWHGERGIECRHIAALRVLVGFGAPEESQGFPADYDRPADAPGADGGTPF